MDNIKFNKIKIVFFLVIFLTLFILGGLYLLNPKNQFSLRSKAAGANGVDLAFIGSATVAATANTEYNVTISKTSSQKISVANIVFEYPASIFDYVGITYQAPFVRSALAGDGLVTGANRVIIFTDGSRGTGGALADQSATSMIASVKFKVKAGVANNTSGNFRFAQYEIVGETTKLTLEQHNPLTVTAGSGLPAATSTPTQVPGATNTPTPTRIPGVTNTPTPTQIPGATATPTPTTSASGLSDFTLNLKLKFQGVLKKPASGMDKMLVKVTAVSSGNSESKTAEFTANDNGIWTGSVTFTGMPIRPNYKILIKGPKHIQKKICVANPTETYPGTYGCADGNINIVVGENSLDFSSIYQLVGDLPDQDGFVNSYDTSLVRNNLGNTDTESLRVSDLNLDGAVNAQDFSLVIAALSIRTDEH